MPHPCLLGPAEMESGSPKKAAPFSRRFFKPDTGVLKSQQMLKHTPAAQLAEAKLLQVMFSSLNRLGLFPSVRETSYFSSLLYELMLALDLCREGLFWYFNGSFSWVFCVVLSIMACTV